MFWHGYGDRTKENESSTGHVWAAGFHHVTAHSCLACALKLMNHLFHYPPNFGGGGHGKPQILNSWIRGHDCIRRQATYIMQHSGVSA
jgi:hypothetical protein